MNEIQQSSQWLQLIDLIRICRGFACLWWRMNVIMTFDMQIISNKMRIDESKTKMETKDVPINQSSIWIRFK